MLAELDFAPLRSGGKGSPAGLAAAVTEACVRDGGFVAVGHGVSAVDGLLLQASRFFELGHGEREAVRVNGANRGYSPIGEGGKPGFLPDAKEVFQVGSIRSGDNVWPELDGFRTELEGGLAELQGFALELLGLLATGLGLGPGALEEHCRPPAVVLRLHHYPAVADGSARRFGAAPHTDYGTIGLIAEAPSGGGLEAQDQAGAWVPVDAPPGALVVIAGELLAWWSGGRLRALPHRVPVPAGGPRFSVATFVNPSAEARLRPIGSDREPALSVADFIAALVAQREAARAAAGPATLSAQPS